MATKVTASKIGRFDRRLVIALLIGLAIVAGLWWFPVRSQIAAHDEYRNERDMLAQRVEQTRADIAAVETGTGADVENLWQVAGAADELFPTRVSDSEMITFLPELISSAGLTYDNLGKMEDGDSDHSTMRYRYVNLTLRGDVDRVLAFVEQVQALSGSKFATVHDVSITGIGGTEATVNMQVRFWYSTQAAVTSTAATDDTTEGAPATSTPTQPVNGGDAGDEVSSLDDGPLSGVVDAATGAVNDANTTD